MKLKINKIQKLAIILSIGALTVVSCEKNDEKDEEVPKVQLVLPLSCDTLYVGESFQLKAQLTDNEELASYSIDIHNNFDRHGHSTEPEPCQLDEKKEAVDDFRLNENYVLTAGQKDFITDLKIDIPQGKDEGDYHLKVTVLDKTGWSDFTIVGVKLIKR